MACNLRISVKRIRVTTAITLAMLLAFGLSFASLPVQAGFAPDLPDEYWNGDINPKNKLDDLIDYMPDEEFVDIVVLYGPAVMREGCDLSDAAKFLSAYGEVEYVAKYIHAIALSNVLVGDVKSEILPSPNIFRIEKQPIFRAGLDVSARAVKARESDIYSPNTAFELGHRGHGINIAIIDSGVDDGHESLTGKFVAGYNAITNTVENPDDDNTHTWDDLTNAYIRTNTFHGTHCAGIAMGTGGTSGTCMGIAPEARLIDIKVLDHRCWGSWPWITRGIEWAIDNRTTDWELQPPEYDGIDVLSISIWESNSSSNGNSAIDMLLNEAVSAGLVVVAIAGNDGDVNRIGPIGAADRAITVGAVDDQVTVDRSNDVWADFPTWGSQTGPRADDGDVDHFDEMKPDIVAPGVNIHSAQGNTVSGYHDLSGTSMACPHVAGIAALILQLGETVGGYTPDMVKTILRDTAEDRGGTHNPAWDPTWDDEFGKGIVDAYACLASITPTDLGFLPGSCPICGQTGRRVCWPGNSVIYLDDWEPVANVPNRIHAVVSNYGPNDVTGATVIFSYARTGIGVWVFHEIDRTVIGPILSGGTANATVDWTPQFPEPGERIEHGCIRAEVIYQSDTNLNNNVGQINVDVRRTSSPADLNFMIVNPFAVAKQIDLVADKADLPPGWTTVLSSDRGIFPDTDNEASFSMGEACPEYVTLTITPREDAGYGETGSVTVKMYIEGDYIGEQTLVAIVPKPVELPTITSITPDHGNQGETLDVIITGTNFDGATEVSFGAGITVNSFNVDSSTQITASIDIDQMCEHRTTTISVTTPAGIATLEDGFTVQLQKGCFIATAAYGTPMAEEIEILREFRDGYLLTNPLGQALTDLYYRVSPPIAEFITEHPSLKPIVRAGLIPAVAMSTIAVSTTMPDKIAILGLLVLVSVAAPVWLMRRRGRGPEYNQG